VQTYTVVSSRTKSVASGKKMRGNQKETGGESSSLPRRHAMLLHNPPRCNLARSRRHIYWPSRGLSFPGHHCQGLLVVPGCSSRPPMPMRDRSSRSLAWYGGGGSGCSCVRGDSGCCWEEAPAGGLRILGSGGRS
jgi:hypothetical protein